MQEKVFIKNKKGLNLAGILHYPDKNNKYPAVILLHGFTGYKEEEHIETLADILSKNGFVAIRFDCSGFGESEGNIKDDFRFTNYLSDIEFVYKYLISLDYVDNEKVGIWGHSMGAQLSIIFVSKHPELKAVCSVSSPISIRMSKSDDDLLKWKKQGYLIFNSSKFGSIKVPFEFIEDRETFNTLDYVKQIRKPLLIIIGNSDDIVSPNHTKQIFTNSNEPHTLIEVDGMGHDYKKFPSLLTEVNKKIIDFFQENL